MPEPATSLDEIRTLLAHLPGPDLESGTAAATRERQLTKPAGALGRLEELATWLATWQARHPPRLETDLPPSPDDAPGDHPGPRHLPAHP